MDTLLSRIPARAGVAARVARGQTLRIINTHGSQVLDTWAFNAEDPGEYMSMEHTRASCKKLKPGIGEAFVTNHRRSILTLLSDSSPGVHDTLIAACDPYRYLLLGHAGHHDNCTENLHAALSSIGLKSAVTPCPLNLFMNTPADADGAIRWLAPVSRPGEAVELRAEIDCVVVFSACPMDLLPINGEQCLPRDAHYAIL